MSEEKDDFYGVVKRCEEIASSPSAPRNDIDGMDSRFRGNDKRFKPYYVAHTKIQTLTLLDEEHKGSNWYHWRKEQDSNLRGIAAWTLSRRLDSTTLPSFPKYLNEFIP